MSIAGDDRRPSGFFADRGLALLALAATVLCRVPTFLRPVLDPDEATFASIASLMNAGGRLYAEGGVDNKFPGIYWTYASVFAVFGRYAMGAVHALELAVVLATALLVGSAARELARDDAHGDAHGDARSDGSTSVSTQDSERVRWLAVLFYGVYTSVYYSKMIAANTEIFMMLPLTASFLATLRSRTAVGLGRALAGSLLAGALVGAACLWKQIAVVCLPLAVAAPLVSVARDAGLGRSWLRRSAGAATAAAGFSATLLATAAWLSHEGTLGAWWHWTVERIATHYGPSAWQPGEYAAAFAVGVGPFVVCAAVPALATFAVLSRARRAAPTMRLALAWLVLCAVGVAAGGHYFGHYFLQVVAPLSAIGAVEIDRRLVAAKAGPRRLGVAVAVGTGLPALAFCALAIVSDPITQLPGGPPPGYDELAAYVRAHTASDERVFVWGLGGPFYLSADRLPATRFVGFLRGLARDRNELPEAAWDTGPEVWPALLEDFAAHPPSLVIDTSTADYFSYRAYPMSRFPVLQRYLDGSFEKADTIGGVDVYRRRR